MLIFILLIFTGYLLPTSLCLYETIKIIKADNVQDKELIVIGIFSSVFPLINLGWLLGIYLDKIFKLSKR